MEKKKVYLGLVIKRMFFLIFLIFSITKGSSQNKPNYYDCCFSNYDTVIMIGDIGGKRFMINKEYLNKQNIIKLNFDDLKIVSFRWGMWGDIGNAKSETDSIPFLIKNTSKKIPLFFIKNIVAKTKENQEVFLNKEFIVYIKYD